MPSDRAHPPALSADIDPRRPHTVEEFEAVMGKMEANLEALLNSNPFGRDGERPKAPTTYGVYLFSEPSMAG